jgi:hypothetical protein
MNFELLQGERAFGSVPRWTALDKDPKKQQDKPALGLGTIYKKMARQLATLRSVA